MDMRTYSIAILAALCLTASAGAQQVEYVTRGSLGGHAIRFGSNPHRASLPQAYVRVNNSRHAIGSRATPLDARVPIRLIRIHGTDHVIPTVAVRQDSPRGQAPETRQVRETRVERPAPPAPSRHALMVHSIMKNKLDCHP